MRSTLMALGAAAMIGSITLATFASAATAPMHRPAAYCHKHPHARGCGPSGRPVRHPAHAAAHSGY